MKPQRIQRRRSKGWRMPPNTVYVGRPSKWGNPFFVGNDLGTESVESGIESYKQYIMAAAALGHVNFSELKGKNLACWCKAGDPCHADFLIEKANP